ncbi:MAG: SIS domain-containing protein [Phycisphaerales bacterium]
MLSRHTHTITCAIERSVGALDRLRGSEEALAAAASLGMRIAACFRAGGKILICGNGGSCCDANHFAEELTGRFRADRPPLPAIACVDAAHITCTANDFGFDHVFERWVTALGKPGDVLIVLSTSGNSQNILLAARAGRSAGMHVAAMLGKDGGTLHAQHASDTVIIVPGETSDRIQELHMLLLHALVESVERDLFPELGTE